MATSRRLQVASGAGAVLLLVAAWVLTGTGDETGSSASTTTTTTTEATTTSTEPTTTSTTEAVRPPNEQWGALNLTDVTEEAGLDEPHATEAPIGADGQAAGAAVADYDDDGDQDVFLTRIGLPNRLLRNDGDGRFADVAEQTGATGPDPDDGYAGAVWADVDGDADLDLYLTGAGRGGSALLVNDGTGRFSDGTEQAGLGGLAGSGLEGTASYGAAFEDWDRDGDLDLVHVHWYRAPFDLQLRSLGDPGTLDPRRLEPCVLAPERASVPGVGDLPGSRTALFANDGTGRFTDVTATSGVAVDDIVGFQPVFADVDGDGWADLFITGDYCTSRLYRNDAGRGFTDITAQAGVGTDQNGMGSVVADLDGDGNLDWFVSAISSEQAGPCAPGDPCSRAGNRLYLGDGRGRFTDATDRFGVRSGSWGWGAAAADLNLDGRLDLALANGVRFRDAGESPDPTLQAGDDSAADPTRVWVNTGTEPWPEVADTVGVRDRANGKAMVAFDADGDGDLDLLIANTTDPPVLYRNDTPPGPDKHWLVLRLRAPGTANPYAVGAEAVVDRGDGSVPQRRRVAAGGSYQSGDPTDLHVGLGASGRVARIEVRWPDGSRSEVTDVAADQVVELTP